MTSNPTEFHQLGNFIYLFQIVERQIEDIILLLARADDENGKHSHKRTGFFGKA